MLTMKRSILDLPAAVVMACAALNGGAVTAVAQQSLSPSLESRVFDEVTGQPVEGAYVGADSGRVAAVTDGRGEFGLELSPELDQRVVVSAFGYREDTLSVETEDGAFRPLEVALAPSPLALEGIRAEGVMQYRKRIDVRRNRTSLRSRTIGREVLRVADQPHLLRLMRDEYGLWFDGLSQAGCVRTRMGPEWSDAELYVDERPVTLNRFESIRPDRFALVEIFGDLMSVDQIRAYTPQYLAKRSREGGWPVPLGMSAGLCP